MLSQNILGVQQRYKVNTTIFVTWLATEAMKLSYVLPTPGEVSATSNPSPQPMYQIPISEFIKQAQVVRDATSPVQTPRWAGEALRHAIRGRRRVTEYFSNFPDNDPESDARHGYFTNRLEDIANMLAIPLAYSRLVPIIGNDSASTKPSMSTTNLFETLDLESDVDDDEVIQPPKSVSLGLTVLCEPEHAARDEARLRALCFLQEMHNVQDRVAEMLKQYAAGEMSIEEATLLVGAAIELVK
jgi:hypothetical protein